MITVFWRSDSVTIEDPPDILRDELSYYYKTISENKVVMEKRYCFQEEGNIWIAPQGFFTRIKNFLSEKGFLFKVVDDRTYCPDPDYSKCHGFIHVQEKIVREVLDAKKSGMFNIVTRGGKSFIAANIMRAFPTLQTVVTAPGTDLCTQLHEEYLRLFPDREVKGVYTGSKNKSQATGNGITVCSLDSLEKMSQESTQLLICDEVQGAATATRYPVINGFKNARRYGMSGTVTGRFSGDDIINEGLFGPVLSELTYKEAVKNNIVLPLHVIMVNYDVPFKKYWDRRKTYEDCFWKSKKIASFVKNAIESSIPDNFQGLFFIESEDAAEHFNQYIDGSNIVMAKLFTAKQRKEVVDDIKSGKIRLAIASKILTTGLTFNHIRFCWNLDGGSSIISLLQRCGRLIAKRPRVFNKKCGILIDFKVNIIGSKTGDSPIYQVLRESQKREKIYKDTGYVVHHISMDCEKLKEKIKEIAF